MVHTLPPPSPGITWNPGEVWVPAFTCGVGHWYIASFISFFLRMANVESKSKYYGVSLHLVQVMIRIPNLLRFHMGYVEFAHLIAFIWGTHLIRTVYAVVVVFFGHDQGTLMCELRVVAGNKKRSKVLLTSWDFDWKSFLPCSGKNGLVWTFFSFVIR